MNSKSKGMISGLVCVVALTGGGLCVSSYIELTNKVTELERKVTSTNRVVEENRQNYIRDFSVLADDVVKAEIDIKEIKKEIGIDTKEEEIKQKIIKVTEGRLSKDQLEEIYKIIGE